MSFLFDNIWKQFKTVHKTVHDDMSNKLKYTEPKIFHGGKNYSLKKDWYVYFYIEDPTKPIPGGGYEMKQFRHKFKVKQLFKTKKDRMFYLRFCRDTMSNMLKNGFNPFEQEVKEKVFKSAEYNLKYALKVKSKEIKATTYNGYEWRLSKFIEFLEVRGLKSKDISYVQKKHVSEFLNKYNANSSNKMKAMLSSLYAILASEDIVPFNFIKEIRNKKVIEKKTKKLFTREEIKKALDLLKEQDKLLYNFIELVGFMFWRPLEVVRIKSDNVDIKSKLISSVETKAKASKTKLIPQIMLDSIKDLMRDENVFLLTPEGSENWENTEEVNKRNYFTKRFRKFRRKNKLSEELTPYTFRYYFITTAYLNLRKENDIEQSIRLLSRITGHTSKAIHNYILVNDIELPEDYSEYLRHSSEE